jgi:hypothetical protein
VQKLSCQYSHGGLLTQTLVQTHDHRKDVVLFAHVAEIPGHAALERLLEKCILYTLLFIVKLCPHGADFPLHLCPQPLPATFARNHVVKI